MLAGAAGLVPLGIPAAGAAVPTPGPGGVPGALTGRALPAPGPTAQSGSAAGTALVGTFRITSGSCAGAVSGSYFRMTAPGGSPVSNSDSSCSDKSYTPLAPGTDGGLVTGTYQAEPSPAFDSAGNGLAGAITHPVRFYGVDFATATDRTDPQSGRSVTAPAVYDDGGHLSGDLRAFTVAWNNQHFNQGSPKPDGSRPGSTTAVTGTYNPSSGAYQLTWSSQIVGGPFNNFTGTWRLVGTFAASGHTSAPAASGGSGSTGTPASSGTATSAPTAAPDSTGATASPAAGGDAATSGPASTGLPTTGWQAPLVPAGLLLGAGLLLRRRAGTAGRRPGREDRP